MIYINGSGHIKCKNKKGEYHRVNGPAAVIRENYQSWHINGKRHRIGGPALIIGDIQHWHIDGVEYTETDYHDKLKQMGLV